MTPRDSYPPGVPCWIDLAAPDVEAALAFYGGLFGWSFEDRLPAEVPGSYQVATIDGLTVGAIASRQPDDDTPVAWATFIAVADADESARTVASAGGAVVGEPIDVMDAGRLAVCTDPAGAVFSLWQAGTTAGAQLVNAHGSLNFNDLSTPDVAAAAAFYGAVFGWELMRFAPEAGGGAMWTLAGYGDHLERLEPGMRQRQREMGAPAGFEDVVASVSPLDPTAGGAARWDVTFAVDDCDVVADRAAALGGRVLDGPVDLGPVRSARIADPAGATFTASQFFPERL